MIHKKQKNIFKEFCSLRNHLNYLKLNIDKNEIMTLIKNNHSDEKNYSRLNHDTKNSKSDVVDRFLSVLWRREVDLKLTTK